MFSAQNNSWPTFPLLPSVTQTLHNAKVIAYHDPSKWRTNFTSCPPLCHISGFCAIRSGTETILTSCHNVATAFCDSFFKSLYLFLITCRSTQIKTYSWDNAQVVLAGNKCDMEEERVVSVDSGRLLAEQLGKSWSNIQPLMPSGMLTKILLRPVQRCLNITAGSGGPSLLSQYAMAILIQDSLSMDSDKWYMECSP